MIIPIRCMNCGKLLADKWNYYKKRVKELKKSDEDSSIVYIEGGNIPNSPENVVLNELGMVRYCCRKHMLTNVTLIDKL